jgi:hypothetical protein
MYVSRLYRFFYFPRFVRYIKLYIFKKNFGFLLIIYDLLNIIFLNGLYFAVRNIRYIKRSDSPPKAIVNLKIDLSNLRADVKYLISLQTLEYIYNLNLFDII